MNKFETCGLISFKDMSFVSSIHWGQWQGGRGGGGGGGLAPLQGYEPLEIVLVFFGGFQIMHIFIPIY